MSWVNFTFNTNRFSAWFSLFNKQLTLQTHVSGRFAKWLYTIIKRGYFYHIKFEGNLTAIVLIILTLKSEHNYHINIKILTKTRIHESGNFALHWLDQNSIWFCKVLYKLGIVTVSRIGLVQTRIQIVRKSPLEH